MNAQNHSFGNSSAAAALSPFLGFPEPDRKLRHKGRGSSLNRMSTRFRDLQREPTRELWDVDDVTALKTQVYIEQPKTILTRNQSPDIPFDRSVNAYRGCEHGCVYCFARPTHAYLGLSPGLDFETKLTAKPNAALLLEQTLCKPGYDVAPIAMGTNTDPYQPIEDQYRITRQMLEVLARFGHPVTITTKSFRVTRDIDILARMAEKNLVSVNISVTTLNRDLARTLEPRASTPARRLEAIKLLSEAGITVNVFASPMIPALNDHELEKILEQARAAGARGASSIVLRLPHEVKELFRDWLAIHVPDRATRIMHHIQDMRGGKDNDPRFGSRMHGSGVYAELLTARFRAACARLGLNRESTPLTVKHFAVPEDSQFSPAQKSLF